MTIAAADPANPPVVSGLDLRGASNLIFEGISFDYTYQDGQPIWFKPFMALHCENLSFSGCSFSGDLAQGLTEADNGYPTAFGLYVTGSSGVTIADCEISGFYRGMVVSNCDDVVVARNDIHSIRMDGMNFSAVQGVVIEDNHIHDFARSLDSADHSDMIQFWTNGTTRPSTDIVIRDNLLDIGEGEYTQSIFMRNDLVDRGLAGEEMYYQNVLIEGNKIINAHSHGITVGETDGLTISNNSVLHDDGASRDGVDSTVEIPRISVAANSTDVTISQNVTSDIIGYTSQGDWVIDQNVLVQDQSPSAAGWYGDMFVTSSLTRENGEIAFIPVAGGIIDMLDAGATSPQGQGVGFQVFADDVGNRTLTFEASGISGNLPEGTVYVWDFGDGTSATGRVVEYQYADGGTYAPHLTAWLPNGESLTAGANVTVHDPELVFMDKDGHFVIHSEDSAPVLRTCEDSDDGAGLHLGAVGASASVARADLAPLFQDENLEISFSIDADSAGSTGEIFRLHGSFVVGVDRNGVLVVRAWSSEGDAVALRSTGVRVNDLNDHDIGIRLRDGHLSLWVDGEELATAAFNGSFADCGRHDLTFGNIWGAQNFHGDLTSFAIGLDPGMSDPFTGLIAASDQPLI